MTDKRCHLLSRELTQRSYTSHQLHWQHFLSYNAAIIIKLFGEGSGGEREGVGGWAGARGLHAKYEILSIKPRRTTHCCGWVTVVLSCKSQTLEIKDRPVDLFHAGNRWPSMCCSVCASLPWNRCPLGPSTAPWSALHIITHNPP